MNLDEALDAYWSAAYAEGQSGAAHDTPDGRAQCALQAVLSCVRIAIAAEREKCKRAVRDTKDKSGVNDDGQSWLMRASRGDFMDAIDAL